MDDDRFAKIAKMETSPGYLDGLQNVDAKIEHQYYEGIGTLDKIHDPIRR